MVDNFEVWRNSPSVAFLFAHLGSLVELSGDPLGAPSPNGSYPQVEDFVSRVSGLGLALGVLYPLLLKSQVWFRSVRGILRGESMGFEEGSSDLERGSSSNVGEEGAGVDTATTVPSRAPSSSHSLAPAVVRPFHALKENCSLKIDSSFLRGPGLVFPGRVKRLAPLPTGKFAFMRLLFRVASSSPSIRSSWSFFIILTLHRGNLCLTLGE